jgi:hypothetical protein
MFGESGTDPQKESVDSDWQMETELNFSSTFSFVERRHS